MSFFAGLCGGLGCSAGQFTLVSKISIKASYKELEAW